MNIGPFLTCISYYNISTGASNALEGVYSFNSGTTGIIYNQLYTTGQHFISGEISSQAVPLINLSPFPFTGNQFSGNNGYSIGYKHTGNFGIILDIASNGCSKRSGAFLGKNQIIISTVDNISGLSSGFYLGITDSNRLFLQTSGKLETLNKELSVRDLIYVGLVDNRYIDFGIVNMADNSYFNASLYFSGAFLNTSNLYLGEFFNNNNTGATGFFGNIYHAILFKDSILPYDISVCADCSFVSGYNTVTGYYASSGYQITGTYFSGIQEVAVTGLSYITGTMTRTNGQVVNVIVQSGLSGLVTTGEIVFPLFSGIPFTGTRNDTAFLYDLATLSSFSQYSIDFDLSLTSGDVVEIYTYSREIPYLSRKITGNMWPQDTGFIQLFGNGLAETNGVDYYVSRNSISGFFDDDNLTYDILKKNSTVIPYSGYWYQSRIAVSGGGFFPPSSQFNEPTGITGAIFITGLSGICTGNNTYPFFGYDLYLNGQKLVSGYQYSISGSGTNGFVVILTGTGLPYFSADQIPETGIPSGFSDIQDNELSFIPQYSGFYRYLFNITGSQVNLTNITGFSEQVWLNGIRQYYQRDYRRFVPCSFVSGIIDIPILEYVLYSSLNLDTTGYWNFVFPTTYHVSGATGMWVSGSTGYSIGWTGGINYYPTGLFVELYSKLTYPDGSSDEYFIPSGMVSTQATGITGWLPSSRNHRGFVQARYHSGNVFGPFGVTKAISGMPQAPNKTGETINYNGPSTSFTGSFDTSSAFSNYYLQTERNTGNGFSGFSTSGYPNFNVVDTVPITLTYNYRAKFIDGTTASPYYTWYWYSEIP